VRQQEFGCTTLPTALQASQSILDLFRAGAKEQLPGRPRQFV
jgi:hypothetical protein